MQAFMIVIVVALFLTHLNLTWKFRFIQFRKLKKSGQLFFKNEESDGDISPFQALMTSLAGCMGIGNIAGVALALVLGGPGVIFWMWISALLGGATRFYEVYLGNKHRITNANQEKSGGPMYYLSQGIKGKGGKILGVFYALFCVIAALGIGNMIQSKAITDSILILADIPKLLIGLAVGLLSGLIILKGVKKIGQFVSIFLPLMALIYILGCVVILIMKYDRIYDVFMMIFQNAFSGKAIGATLFIQVVRYGLSFGMFTNETGMGTGAIAHAASKNTNPYHEGLMGMIAPAIDTLFICTLTAFVILSSDAIGFENGLFHTKNITGIHLTTLAFYFSLGEIGNLIVTVGILIFGFATIIGWYYFGLKALEFLFGTKYTKIYSYLYIIVAIISGFISNQLLWNVAEIFNLLMALPNIIGLYLLAKKDKIQINNYH